jgi:hypothetical protein
VIESLFIMGMAAGDDNAKRAGSDFLDTKFLKPAANVSDKQFLRLREAFAAGIGCSVVQDPNIEIDFGR